jgi:hypothetical protein
MGAQIKDIDFLYVNNLQLHMKVKVFYHVFIPPDIRAASWTLYVDEQLGMIKNSKLSDCAGVYVTFTMPKFWTGFGNLPYTSEANPNNFINFGERVHEYMSRRYPWVTILEIRDINANIFEGLTLKYLHDASQKEDFLALYIHTKGITTASETVLAWKQLLNHYHINQWPQAIRLLDDYQVVGMQDAHSVNHPIVSGNFFWARSDYIRGLVEPLDTRTYTHEQQLWPGNHAYRYGFELWILSQNPQVYYWVDTKINHYDKYCFLEELLKQNPPS